MRSTDFRVDTHGYAFHNGFVTRPIPFVRGIAFPGLCGGMSFSALDYFHAGRPIPAVIDVPSAGSGLERYIRARQVDSVNPFVTPSARKYFTWAPRSRDSIRSYTESDSVEAAMRLIDSGQPAALGLVSDSLWPTHSHQVVAFAYEVDSALGTVDFLIYENNRPGQIVKLTLRTGESLIDESVWDGSEFQTFRRWKGFFVQDYRPKPPRFLES